MSAPQMAARGVSGGWTAIAFVLPALVGLGLFLIVPILMTLALTVTDQKLFSPDKRILSAYAITNGFCQSAIWFSRRRSRLTYATHLPRSSLMRVMSR